MGYDLDLGLARALGYSRPNKIRSIVHRLHQKGSLSVESIFTAPVQGLVANPG
jgi:hypothetical protein